MMTNREYRIGIVGASSLAGKELSEELGTSSLAASDFVLLDEEEAAGQVTAAADEVSFIQRLEATSFERRSCSTPSRLAPERTRRLVASAAESVRSWRSRAGAPAMHCGSSSS